MNLAASPNFSLTSSTPPAAPPRLYFAPMACSLASRIVAYEAGIELEYVQADTGAKTFANGGDLRAVNPMGQVPVLELAADVRLTENAAVLQYLAALAPEAGLAPTAGLALARLHQWLGFIGTELHKAVFVPLLGSVEPGAKDEARKKAALRLDVVERHLADRPFLLDRFSIADAYLCTILNWAVPTGVDLAAWPAIQAYHRRLLERPRLAAALGEEFALYRSEQKRRAA